MNSDDNQLPLSKPPTISKKDAEDIDGIRSVGDSFQPFSLNSLRMALIKVLDWNKQALARFQQAAKEFGKLVSQIKAEFQIYSEKIMKILVLTILKL